MGHYFDLTGLVFGRVTILHRSEDRHRRPYWRGRCECGVERDWGGADLRAGKIRSCGCQRGANISAGKLRHGLCYTREHRAWANAKTRCFNPRFDHFHRYGGRGITMCDEWRDSFEAFFRDMGPCPDGHELDRINPDGHYEPGNCRWASRLTQTNNKTNTRWLDFNGERLSVSEWERRMGLRQDCIRNRLNNGWSIEEAITTPNLGRKKRPKR